MDANCNISKITKEIFDNKRLGIQPSDDDVITFIETYINSLGCEVDPCVKVVTPCNRIQQPTCSDFVLPSFRFTQQSYGTSLDFIVNPEDLNGLTPYSYSWTFDPQYFSLRVVGSNLESTLNLTKLQEDQLNLNYLTNVTVVITDANNCSYSKTCQFRYIKNNGVSNPTLNCNANSIVTCVAATGLTISGITNTSFNVAWTELGFQYELIISPVSDSTNIVYHNLYAHSGVTISGLIPNTAYDVKVVTHCFNSLLNTTSGATTLNNNVANINCASATFSPTQMNVGVSYTGTLLIPYTSGNGTSYPMSTQTVAGLVFTLPAGTLNTGSGNLVMDVSGVPVGDINLPITLFGNNCNITKTVQPVCSAITAVIVTIGAFNVTTQLYDVLISWIAVPGALQYTIDDGTNIFTVPSTFYHFSYAPNTTFSGTVSTYCSATSSSTTVPYSGVTPEAPCLLTDITVGNITGDGFSLLSLIPSLTGSQSYNWELYDLGPTGVGIPALIDTGVSSTVPLTLTGLAPSVYQILVQKICGETTSNVRGASVEILAPIVVPTVYVKFDYVNSGPVPYDNYLNACDTRGQHFYIQSKPALITIRTFSDIAGTIPMNVTGMGIVLNFQVNDRYGVFTCPFPGTPVQSAQTITPHTLPLSSTSTPYAEPTSSFVDSYSGAIDCGSGSCIPAVYTKRLVELLPGAGYTLI